MTMLSAGWFLIAFAWPPFCAFAWTIIDRFLPVRRRRVSYLTDWITIAAVLASVCVLFRNWAPALGCAASLLVALVVWWWRRRKRRSVLGLLGAKSKALRDALVRKAREAAKPRPVLRPAPQGSP